MVREVLHRVEEAKRIIEKQCSEKLEQLTQAELTAQKAREEREWAKRTELERVLEETLFECTGYKDFVFGVLVNHDYTSWP
ncbi:hypothetical protein FKM82_008760 [Ascaphus truei]